MGWSAAVTGLGLSANALIIAMLAILLFLGCFVDQVSMMLITLPFFMPLVQRYGIDPIWFGVLFLICMQLGLLTPPFGLLLFTMKGVAPPSITMQPGLSRRPFPYVVMSLADAGAHLRGSADRDLAAGAAEPVKRTTPCIKLPFLLYSGILGVNLSKCPVYPPPWLSPWSPTRREASVCTGRA